MAPGIVISAEPNNTMITVSWVVSETLLSHYGNIKIALNELGKPSGKVYYTIPFTSSNYAEGSYDIEEINGVELQKGSSYTISSTLISKIGKTPLKSNSITINVLKSEPIAPALIVSGGDSAVNITITNMYDQSANQGFSSLNTMWINMVNDVNGDEIFYNYDVSSNPDYLKDIITIDACNNVLYEGTVTIFNEKGSAETAFSVTPSNLPKIVRNLAAYPTVMYNQEKGITDSNGLTTDASSISVFWQKPLNYAELVTASKPITSYVITRTGTDVSANKTITVSTVTSDPYAYSVLFNGITYDNRYIDTDVVIGESYSYSITLSNVNGSSPTGTTASSVVSGSLPSEPTFTVDPSDSLFTFNLTTASSLNGFSLKDNGKLYTLNFVNQSVSAYFNVSVNSPITMSQLPLNDTLNSDPSNAITNGTNYSLSMFASTSYTINGLTTIFNSSVSTGMVTPYGIPSAPSNVRVFALNNDYTPVTDASGNYGLRVLWDSATVLRGNSNPTYSVYVKYNNNNYLTNITNVDNTTTEHIVSSYTDTDASNINVKLTVGTEYNFYVVTKTYNSYYGIYVTSNTIVYYSGTPLTYPSVVSDLSLNNTNSTTMVATFTPVSTVTARGGFANANIQYSYILTDLSLNSQVNSGTLTTGKVFTGLTAGNPYSIAVYTQGLYTSTDTSSNTTNGVSGPKFINTPVQHSTNNSSTAKISYYSPNSPENVEVGAIYNLQLSSPYAVRVSWDSPLGLSNSISNGVKLTKYLIYIVQSSYSGSLNSITASDTLIDITSEYAIINQYSDASGVLRSMVSGGTYKVYVGTQGTIGGYTKYGYVFPLTTVYGDKSSIMYDELLSNPQSVSTGISYITTLPGPEIPSDVTSSSTSTTVTISWTKNSLATEYIIYRDDEPYIKSFLVNGSFTDLDYDSNGEKLSFTITESTLYTYYISAVVNGIQSYPASIQASPNAPPGDVTNTSFTVSTSSVTINWTSPSFKSNASSGLNSNLFTKITIYDPSSVSLNSQTLLTANLSSAYSATFTGLPNNVAYSAIIYSFYTINGNASNQVVSNDVTVTNMIPNPPPTNATFTTTTTGDGSITLNWSNPTDFAIYPFATNFTILRTGTLPNGSESSYSLSKTITVANSVTTYTDASLNNGYKYSYTLIASRSETLQPSGVTITNIIPSGKPQFASAITSLGYVNGEYKFTVTMDRNGSDLTGSSFIGIPSSSTATSLIFGTGSFTGVTYGNTTTNELLTNQLYQYSFGFNQQISAVFLSVSNTNGMVTGASSSTYFTTATDTSTA